MTPSAWLLQHEYEFHGTCMPDAALSSPAGYFRQAQALHAQLQLPDHKLANNRTSVNWLVRHNPGLKPNMFYYSGGEWRFCYNDKFQPTRCPSTDNTAHNSRRNQQHQTNPADCHIKGNISARTKKKLYYLPGHRTYYQVLINPNKGERCFNTEAEAVAAGWRKAS
jgi:ribonuclease T2